MLSRCVIQIIKSSLVRASPSKPLVIHRTTQYKFNQNHLLSNSSIFHFPDILNIQWNSSVYQFLVTHCVLLKIQFHILTVTIKDKTPHHSKILTHPYKRELHEQFPLLKKLLFRCNSNNISTYWVKFTLLFLMLFWCSISTSPSTYLIFFT